MLAGTRNALIGCLVRLLGPVIAPHVLLIAQCLQVSIGIFAVAEAGLVFKDVNNLAKAIITITMTLIALPDSFSWALKPGSAVGDVWAAGVRAIGARQHRIEAEASLTAELALTMIHERTEHVKETSAVVMASVPCATSIASGIGDGDGPVYRTLRPFVRILMVKFDSIGETARASPLLIVVLVLDASLFVNDFKVPNLHMFYHLHGLFFPPPPIPEMWASRVATPPFPAEWHDVSDCHAAGPGARFEGCGVLGPPNSTCAASGASRGREASGGWVPAPVAQSALGVGAGAGSARGTTREGARFEFAHPLRASYLDVHYQLALSGARGNPAGARDWRSRHSPARFTLRIELVGNHSYETFAELREEKLYSVHVDPLFQSEIPRVYDIAVSVSLFDRRDRNVSITPVHAGAARVIVGDDKPPPAATGLAALPGIGALLAPTSSVQPMVKSGSFTTTACPRPLRLRLLAHDGIVPVTRVLTRSAIVTRVADGRGNGGGAGGERGGGEGLELSIDAVMLEGAAADDAAVEEEIEVEINEEEEVEDVMPDFKIPWEEIISLLAAVSTAAASSEFVRMHVKPEEYAKQKAKEGDKKTAQLAKNSADTAVRALVATPLDKVDIEAAKLTIDEAHDANVMRSLIEKSFEHVQKAVEVQLMAPHYKGASSELV